MPIRRCLTWLALLLCLGALTGIAVDAWAKDEEVLTVEGPAVVNTSRGTVTIGGLTLRIDEGSYIEINENLDFEDDATLDDLAAFLRRNPDVIVVGEYVVFYGALIATSVVVDTSQTVVGPIRLELERQRVSVGSVTLLVTDDTEIYIEDDYTDLEGLAAYLAEHPETQAAAIFMTDAGKKTLLEIDVNSEGYLFGPISVDAPARTVTVAGLSMVVTDDTEISIDYEPATLDRLAALVAQSPGLRADASYRVENGVVAIYIDVSTSRAVFGPFTVDLNTNRIEIQGLSLQVTWDTEILINDDPNYVLTDLAAFLATHPNTPATVGYVASTGEVSTITVDTRQRVRGRIRADALSRLVTVDGVTMTVTEDTWIWVDALWDYATLEQLAAFLSSNPNSIAEATYLEEGGVRVALDIEIPDPEEEGFAGRASSPAPQRVRRAAHRSYDIVGIVTGMDAARSMVSFRQPNGRVRTLKVRHRTTVELNAAPVPFDLLTRTWEPGMSLFIETVYEPDTRVAKRIWCEYRLTPGAGQVRRVDQSRTATAGEGATLTVASQERSRTRVEQVQTFTGGLVFKKGRLVKPARIRRGDRLAFDSFQCGGRCFAPRVLIDPPKRR